MTTPPRDDSGSAAQARAELLRRLRAHRPAEADADDGLPTFAQQRFWFLEQLEPGNPAHHVAGVIDLHGPLAPDRLRAAVAMLIARHTALRTVLPAADGTPRPEVLPPFSADLPLHDLRQLPVDERQGRQQRLLDELLQAPFALARGPLLRQCLLRLGDEHWQHAFCIHHVAVDGLSMRVLARELAAAYRGERLPPAPDPAWLGKAQRSWLQSAAGQAQLRAAEQELANLPALALPNEQPRREGQPARGDRVGLALTADERQTLATAARDLRITPFQLHAAALAAFVHRLTGADDFALGALAANRSDPGLHDAVGFFVNSLPLRIRWTGAITFAQLAARTRDATLRAYDRQQVPFEKLVEGLAPERHPTRHPLFQIGCNHVDFAPDALSFGDVQPHYRELVAGTLLDLTLYVRAEAAATRLEFEFDARRFEPDVVAEWLRSVRSLLLCGAAAPDLPLADLALLDEDQGDRLRTGDVGPPLPATGVVTVDALLQQRLRNAGQRVVLATDTATLTATELLTRATTFADRLRAAGLRPDDRVAVTLSRSVDLVPWLLAIWRCQAAWVPIDAALPPGRQRRLAVAANARLHLVDPATAAALPADLPVTLVDALPAAADGGQPELPADGERPAYVLFTSGSTGEPKGVVVPHRALLAFLLAIGDVLQLGPADTCLAITTLGFDIALLELLAPLVHGGAVRLADSSAVGDPIRLAALLAEPAVTLAQATPPTWQLVRAHGFPGRRDLRVLTGGQALPADLATFLAMTCRQAWNVYGPTETTVWSLAWRIGAAPPRIGRPLPGTWLRVLDRDGHALPPGTEGELGIGGAGVALGYLGQPAATTARFVDDPLGNGRLYRTGDRVRRLPDGDFLFLGRGDAQLKIAGHRVEPEEIEAALRRHPTVADAAVDVRGTGDPQRLCAWLVPRHSTPDLAAHTDAWTAIWEQTYRQPQDAADLRDDLRGWIDSTTGRPLPRAPLLAWRDSTVAKLLARRPREVLDLGCGSGLLLEPLVAAGCSVTGIDASAAVLEQLRTRLENAGRHATLVHGPLHELDRQLPADARYDLVILNSVAQYFADFEALLTVLDRAAALLQPGGVLFVGDVRLLPLHRAFCASVELARAEPTVTSAELLRRIDDRCRRDPELLLAPAAFAALAACHPVLTDARIELHARADDDELTRFRADVTLLAGTVPAPLAVTALIDVTTAALAHAIAAGTPFTATLIEPRSRPWVDLLGALADERLAGADATAARAFVLGRQRELANAPTVAALHGMAAAAGAGWLHCAPAEPGMMMIAFAAPATTPAAHRDPDWDAAAFARAHAHLASTPFRGAITHDFVRSLQASLRDDLPPALIPGTFAFVAALPRTPGGKLLRRQLPDPGVAIGATHVAPAAGTQTVVAAIFEELLGRTGIGAADDFFALGGHSLLAARLCARLHERLHIALPLRAVFATPTVAGIAAACATATTTRATTVAPVPADAARLLTLAQERLWFLHRLEPESPAWHLAGRIEFATALPPALLQRALERLVERHEPLRCSIDPTTAPPTLRDAGPPRIEIAADTAALAAALPAFVRKPFDLARQTPLRALAAHAEDHTTLLLVLHHLAADGLSLAVLARDLAELLTALAEDRPPEMPELSFPLSAWAAHERTAEVTARRQRQLEFWRPRLLAAPVALDLPVDHADRALPVWAGERLAEPLPGDLWAQAQAFAATRHCTPLHVFGAAFAVLARRLLGADDVVFGLVTAGRTRSDLEHLVGCFVNLLPVHLQVRALATFAEVVDDVKRRAVEALDHGEVPFATLVDLRDPPRDLRRPPLVQVSLEFLDLPVMPARVLGAPLSVVEEPTGASKFEWTIRIVTRPTPRVELEWRTGRLQRTTVTRWWQALLAALRAGLTEPHRDIAALTHDLVTAADRDAQFRAGTGPRTRIAGPALHERILAAAARTPDAIALTTADATRSFAWLHARSLAFAELLRAHGLGRGDVIAIDLGRGFDLLPALLGTMAAGAAWLPLEANDPPARHRQLVRIARTRAWLAERRPDALPDGTTWLAPAELPASMTPQPRPSTALEAHAYVLFTSGSTGEPKPVAIPHRALLHYVTTAVERYLPATGNGAPLFSSVAFDLTITSLFAPLLRGQPVHLAPPGQGIEPLLAVLPRGPFALLKLTPAHLRALAAAGTPVPPATTLVVGGEALRADDVDAAIAAGVTVVNEYGPTEATVGCTAHTVAPADLRSTAPSLPIGVPLPGTRVHVLDDEQRLLPWGAPGELYVAGDGVADGYLHRPEATAARFVADPFVAGATMYRTGDRVRWRPDGALEFLGRGDDQLKIQGVRVEPGEVTAALRALPEVIDAIAIPVPAPAGGRQLAGFVVLAAAATTSATALLERLRTVVPAPLVPRSLQVLPAMPLTANGKIDARALPIDLPPTTATDGGELPRHTTALLAELRPLLRAPKAGPHDDFFALGGDSILALQLVAALARRGLTLPLRAVFAARTAAGMAGAIASSEAEPAPSFDPRAPLPLLPVQRAWVAAALPEPGHDVQAVACELSPAVTVDRLESALAALLTVHPLLQATLADDCLLPGTGPVPHLAIVDVADPADPRWAEAVRTANAAHDPRHGRMFAATLLRGPTARWLHLSIHHIVVDGVSWRILLADLDAALRGLPVPPPLPAHALVQALRHCQTGDHGAFAARWHDHAFAPVADWPPPQRIDARPAHHAIPAVDLPLAALAQRHRASIEELLLAALTLAWLRQRHGPLRVAIERHGRPMLPPELDGSRTIGWFTAIFPLRLASDAATPAAVLRHVKAELRRLPANGAEYGTHQWFATDPFAQSLANALQPAILCNYLGRFDELGGTALWATTLDPGPLRAAANPPRQPFELDLWQSDGRLHGRARRDPRHVDAAAADALLHAFVATLGELTTATAAATAHGTDFPHADLDDRQLTTLLQDLATPPHDLFVATPTQQGMLVHALQQPTSPAYTEQLVHEMVGALDVDALRRAFSLLQQRHPLLRARMAWQDLRQPHWLVVDTELPFTSMTQSPDDPEGAATWLHRFAANDRRSGFDLDLPPLWRCTHVPLPDDHHALVFTWHHTLLDGWSMPLLFAELAAAYGAFAAGTVPQLPLVPPLHEHLTWLRRQDHAAAARFWRQQLAGCTGPTVPGLERLRAEPTRRDRHGECERQLDAAIGQRLQATARQLGVTPSSLLQAALAFWLHRCGGTDDVVFGLTVSGRPAELPQADRRIGLFINTIPVRIRIDPDARVADLVDAVQQQALAALPWHATPLTTSQAQSDAPPGRPLFDVLLVYENYPLDDAARQAPPGLRTVRTWTHERTSYPWTFVVIPGERWLLRLLCAEDRIDARGAAAALDQLAHVLQTFTAAPERPLRDLAVAVAPPPATSRHVPASGILAAIAAVVARDPAHAALIDASGALSGRDLLARTAGLAGALRDLGIAAGNVVALRSRRESWQTVALLATWRCRAALLPIDGAWPLAFTDDVLHRAGCRLILTDDAFTATAAPSLRIDRPFTTAAAAPSDEALADDLALVMTTSGTTGTPRLVAIPHRALAHYVAAARTHFELTPRDRVLQFANLAFDTAFEELLPALTAGATVVLRGDSIDPPRIIAHCERHSVTVLDLPTAWFHAAITALQATNRRLPASIRLCILGGEAVQHRPAAWFTATHPHVRLCNTYGPTETTIVATWCDLTPERLADGEPPPIGTPVPGMQAMVLDPAGQPLPAGTTGMLWLAGPQLANGYLGDDLATRTAFARLPALAGERAYRTGDRARRRDDGLLEFVGRQDHQHKLRGQRIELEAIERRLMEHPAIRQAAAFVHGGATAARLAAAVVPQAEPTPDAATLRRFVGETLPAVQVPAEIALVTALPTNSHGKIDREALARQLATTVSTTTDAVTADPWLATIARAFGQVLERTIGIDDDFFAHGGDSLAAIRLTTLLHTTLRRDVPLATVFAHPTPLALATAIGADPVTATAPPTRTTASGLPADLTFHDRSTRPWRHVLITGANGFFGRQVVAALRQRTSARITALARRDLPADDERTRWLAADLTQPDLGLTRSAHQSLAGVDAVFHVAANTSVWLPFEALRDANVGGTLAMLRLCAATGAELHHVSTLGIFADAELTATTTADETFPLDRLRAVQGGYPQSKLAAERLVHAAIARGLRASIHRPGRLIAGRDGRLPRADFGLGLFALAIELGRTPLAEGAIALAPADWAAHALVHLAQQEPHGRTWHLLPDTTHDLEELRTWLRAAGHALRRVPWSIWRRVALAHLLLHQGHPATGLLPLLHAEQLPHEPGPTVTSTLTRRALHGVDLPPAAMTRVAITGWLRTFASEHTPEAPMTRS
ncbi:MAG: amino acid adenylation domain-containing protein [Planctomycetes bacterium]|nr:amino acid adenylation domain-containing protein [Planctomycetota bacterium]